MACCKNCNTRYTAKELEERENNSIVERILETFFYANGNLYRRHVLGFSYKVNDAALYTLTGGRRVTSNQVHRVLNGGPLYNSKKKK